MRPWRPIGRNELEKIEAAGMRAFPPRLPEQPIFYPVLSFAYAEKIARDWNAVRENHGFEGFVVAFEIDDAFASRYPVQTAGGVECKELWIPAQEFEDFNRRILGLIEVAATYKNGARVGAARAYKKSTV